MWRDASKKEGSRRRPLRITAPDLKEMAIIDEIIPEPDGGRTTLTTTPQAAHGRRSPFSNTF